MKKVLVLLSALLLLCSFSCDIPYDGSRIVQLNHRFFDAQGQPVVGKKIDYYLGYTTPDAGVPPEFSYTTDAAGRIKFSTFYPKQKLYVYAEGYANYRPIESEVQYLDPTSFNTQSFYFLENGETVQFQIQFMFSSSQKSIEKCTMEGIGNHYYSNDNDAIYSFYVAKNQTITIHYTVYNSQTKVSQTLSQDFNIGTGDNYVIQNL